MSDRIPIRRVLDPVSPDSAVLQEAAEELSKGRLVAYPTDTLYGLGADPRRASALERVFRAKGRPAGVAIPLIAADVEQVEVFAGHLSPLGRRLADLFWPGPLTLVVVARHALDRRLLGGRSSVAVRIPDHAIARGLATALGHPITATSANVSGSAAARSAAEVVAALGAEVALVLDGGATGDRPSTIVDVRDVTPVLIRAGVVPWERVLQSLA